MSPEDVSVDPKDRDLSLDVADPCDPAQLPAAQSTSAQRSLEQLPLSQAETAWGGDAQHASWIGRVLDDRYRITEHLGAGGMGDVFVAEHLKLRKLVALKLIRPELAGNGEVAARFAREAMATAQFEHPHVASAIDYGTLQEGGAYFVMQLVRGESLRSLLDRRGALHWPVACELLAQVADALAAARGAGIVHRDLKPENILVETRDDGSYHAKILDFGIAHVMQPVNATASGADRALTRIGTVMGTPGYMSPEQAVGDRVDHRTDLYALGVVLWECLTGKTLWEGADVMSIITRQMRDVVPPPRELLGDPLFPRTLDQLVVRLCARLPDDRPEHAGLVRDELRALARRPLTPVGAITEQASLALTAARARVRALPPRSRAAWIVAGAVLALIVMPALLRKSPNAAAIASGRVEQAAKPETHELEPAVASPRTAAEPAKPSKPVKSEPSLASRALQLARSVVRDDRPAEPAKPTLPKELEPDAQQVLEGKRSFERRRAATKLLRYSGPARLPPYLLSVARLERARTCREREEAIGELDELNDPRTLPAVKRITDAPRTGCGFLSLSDCYACVRTAARKTAAKLSGAPDED